MKIGLLSDTHSFLDDRLWTYLEPCDEIWHAGDIGDVQVIDKLQAFRPLRAVYGNIDNASIRQICPLNLHFECEGMTIFMTHIGGYPGRYTARVRQILDEKRPDIYICGHSHILKVMPDKKRQLLHINPGACGNHGFHKVKTMIRFDIYAGQIKNMEAIELGLRGAIRQ